MAGVDRPLVVVEVEDRVRRDEVHVGLVVGVERAHVAPVAAVALAGAGHHVVREVVDVGPARLDHHRDDVAAQVVLARRVERVLPQRVDHRLRLEHVVAHRGEHLVGRVGQAHRVLGLLPERDDPAALRIGLDHAELVGQRQRLPDGRHRHVRARLLVLLHHLPRVHPVDVVRAEHDDVLGHLVVDQVQILEERVGRAGEPAWTQPLLRGDRGHVVAEHRRQPPGARDVAVKAVVLVLGQYDDLQIVAVGQVGQHEVDEPIHAAERHRRFRPVRRERHEPLSLSTCQHDRKHPPGPHAQDATPNWPIYRRNLVRLSPAVSRSPEICTAIAARSIPVSGLSMCPERAACS